MKFSGKVMPLKVTLTSYFFNPIASIIPKWWTFRLLIWMQNVYQSLWDLKILYSDMFGEQLLIRPFLWKTRNMNVECSWMLKFIFCFMETTRVPLDLDKWRLVPKKIMGTLTGFIWIIILFYEAFKYDDGSKFWGYVGTNTEPPCVEFCNFVHCCIVMKYLTFNLLSVCISPLNNFWTTWFIFITVVVK
jgi:hypothetical protein